MGPGPGVVPLPRARSARGVPPRRPREHRVRAARPVHGGRRGVRTDPRPVRAARRPGTRAPARDGARGRGCDARDGGAPLRPPLPARARQPAARRRPHDRAPSGRDRGAGRPGRLGRALPGIEPQARKRRLPGAAPRRGRGERGPRHGRGGQQQRPRHAGRNAHRRPPRQARGAGRDGEPGGAGASHGDPRRGAEPRARRPDRKPRAREVGGRRGHRSSRTGHPAGLPPRLADRVRGDPVSCARGVGGRRRVVRNGELETLDGAQAVREARVWQARIR